MDCAKDLPVDVLSKIVSYKIGDPKYLKIKCCHIEALKRIQNKGLQFFLGIFSRFFLGFFSRFLGFDGFDWYLQRFAAKLSDLHGVVVVVVVVVVGWMDGWLVGWLVS